MRQLGLWRAACLDSVQRPRRSGAALKLPKARLRMIPSAPTLPTGPASVAPPAVGSSDAQGLSKTTFSDLLESNSADPSDSSAIDHKAASDSTGPTKAQSDRTSSKSGPVSKGGPKEQLSFNDATAPDATATAEAPQAPIDWAAILAASGAANGSPGADDPTTKEDKATEAPETNAVEQPVAQTVQALPLPPVPLVATSSAPSEASPELTRSAKSGQVAQPQTQAGYAEPIPQDPLALDVPAAPAVSVSPPPAPLSAKPAAVVPGSEPVSQPFDSPVQVPLATPTQGPSPAQTASPPLTQTPLAEEEQGTPSTNGPPLGVTKANPPIRPNGLKSAPMAVTAGSATAPLGSSDPDTATPLLSEDPGPQAPSGVVGTASETKADTEAQPSPKAGEASPKVTGQAAVPTATNPVAPTSVRADQAPPQGVKPVDGSKTSETKPSETREGGSATPVVDALVNADKQAVSSAVAPQVAATLPQASPLADSAAAVPATATTTTVAHLSAAIAHKLGEKSSRFDITLDPEGLGRVNVQVNIGQDGRVSAALAFETSHAAAELRNRSEELRQALHQAGFDLSNNGLSFNVAQQGTGGRGQWGDAPSRDPAFVGKAFSAVSEAADEPPPAAWAYRARADQGGIDIRI